MRYCRTLGRHDDHATARFSFKYTGATPRERSSVKANDGGNLGGGSGRVPIELEIDEVAVRKHVAEGITLYDGVEEIRD